MDTGASLRIRGRGSSLSLPFTGFSRRTLTGIFLAGTTPQLFVFIHEPKLHPAVQAGVFSRFSTIRYGRSYGWSAGLNGRVTVRAGVVGLLVVCFLIMFLRSSPAHNDEQYNEGEYDQKCYESGNNGKS